MNRKEILAVLAWLIFMIIGLVFIGVWLADPIINFFIKLRFLFG